MAVVHLPIKCGVDIFIQSREIQDGGRYHLGFLVNLAIPAC